MEAFSYIQLPSCSVVLKGKIDSHIYESGVHSAFAVCEAHCWDLEEFKSQ